MAVSFTDVNPIKYGKLQRTETALERRQGNSASTYALTAKNRTKSKPAKKLERIVSNKERFITDLIVAVARKEPKLTKLCASKPLIEVLPFIKRKIKARGYNVNMARAYKSSQKQGGLIPLLLSALAKGAVVIGDSKRFTKMTSSALKRDGITLIAYNQIQSPSFKKLGKFAGMYLGRPAITKFRLEALEEVRRYAKWGKSKGDAVTAIKASFGLKALPVRNTPLNKPNSYLVQMSDEELAEQLCEGRITKAEIKSVIDAKRFNNINKAIKNRIHL